jgi:hypothetical protein
VATLMTQLEVGKKKIKDRGPLMEEHERQALGLLGEFPNEPGVFEYFIGIARNSDAAKARALVQRVLLMPASAAQKEQARAIQARLDLPGSSPALEWADDRAVARRASDYRGKILVFFVWASWAGESERGAASIAPAIKAGVELVSVNVDTDIQKGQNARRRLTLPGTDYFDERGLQAPLPLQLKADKVPAVHVVDSNGVYVGRGTPAELAGLLQKAGK